MWEQEKAAKKLAEAKLKRQAQHLRGKAGVGTLALSLTTVSRANGRATGCTATPWDLRVQASAAQLWSVSSL